MLPTSVYPPGIEVWEVAIPGWDPRNYFRSSYPEKARKFYEEVKKTEHNAELTNLNEYVAERFPIGARVRSLTVATEIWGTVTSEPFGQRGFPSVVVFVQWDHHTAKEPWRTDFMGIDTE